MRVYNESLDGANYVEEAAIVDQALAMPGIRVALIVVHPSLTASHAFETVQLSQRENVAALGSLSVTDAYKDSVVHSLRKKRPLTDDHGSDIFDPPAHLNAITRNLMRPGCDFAIDPIAYRAFYHVLEACRTRRVRIVLFVSPTRADIFEPKRQAFRKYKEPIQKEIKPGDDFIDFSSGRHCGLRKTRPCSQMESIVPTRARLG